jgi:hypothetical protein
VTLKTLLYAYIYSAPLIALYIIEALSFWPSFIGILILSWIAAKHEHEHRKEDEHG